MIVACDFSTIFVAFFQGYAILRVTILDKNDMRPVFDPILYKFETKEGLGSSGLTVTTVKATDKDEGENAKIIYKIKSGNIGNAFAIHSETVSILAEDSCQLQSMF